MLSSALTQASSLLFLMELAASKGPVQGSQKLKGKAGNENEWSHMAEDCG